MEVIVWFQLYMNHIAFDVFFICRRLVKSILWGFFQDDIYWCHFYHLYIDNTIILILQHDFQEHYHFNFDEGGIECIILCQKWYKLIVLNIAEQMKREILTFFFCYIRCVNWYFFFIFKNIQFFMILCFYFTRAQ